MPELPTLGTSSSAASTGHQRQEVPLSQEANTVEKEDKQHPQEPTAKKEKNIRRRVSFNTRVMVKRSLHVDNYTDQEIEACWYTPTDYDAIRNRIFMTLDLMALSSPASSSKWNLTKNLFVLPYSFSSSTTYCTRGIERYLDSESRQIRIGSAIYAVLNEQYRQEQQPHRPLLLHERSAIKMRLFRQHQYPQKDDDDDDDDDENNDNRPIRDQHHRRLSSFSLQQQQQHQDENASKIRDVYRHSTRSSESMAYALGRSDASEVRTQEQEQEHEEESPAMPANTKKKQKRMQRPLPQFGDPKRRAKPIDSDDWPIRLCTAIPPWTA